MWAMSVSRAERRRIQRELGIRRAQGKRGRRARVHAPELPDADPIAKAKAAGLSVITASDLLRA
jgi:hypothetical protein